MIEKPLDCSDLPQHVATIGQPGDKTGVGIQMTIKRMK